MALILRKEKADGARRRDLVYLSTGNFNEKTAKIYSDMALLTANEALVRDVDTLFALLEGRQPEPDFTHLLVARHNMVPELRTMIQREIDHVAAGRKGYILLKMNGLHDPGMIDELYRASEAGVRIDLIVRGICCLMPDQPYSANIEVTRIVDMFLEHSRIWYFYNDGAEDLFLTSADWMKRNLNRRIDNVKACRLDGELRNRFKRDMNPVKVRAQMAIYDYLRRKNEPTDE